MKDIPVSNEKESSKWLVDLFREKVLCNTHSLKTFYIHVLRKYVSQENLKHFLKGL